MMPDVERILTARGIKFHRFGNYMRSVKLAIRKEIFAECEVDSCFPRIVDVYAQQGLEVLSGGSDSGVEPSGSNHVQPELPRLNIEPNEHLAKDPEYEAVLENNVISKAKTLVEKCLSSEQRRQELRRIIEDGIIANEWPVGPALNALKSLTTADSRWSSVYSMLQSLLYLYPVRQQ